MMRPSRTIAYPFHIGHDGGIAYVEDPRRQAMQSIIVTLLTQPGERVMLPGFGTPTNDFLFENINDTAASEVVLRVRQSLSEWASDAVIHDVMVSEEDFSEGALTVVVTFSVPPSQEVLTTVVDVGGALNGGSSG